MNIKVNAYITCCLGDKSEGSGIDKSMIFNDDSIWCNTFISGYIYIIIIA